jgi:hypothetical protein
MAVKPRLYLGFTAMSEDKLNLSEAPDYLKQVPKTAFRSARFYTV